MALPFLHTEAAPHGSIHDASCWQIIQLIRLASYKLCVEDSGKLENQCQHDSGATRISPGFRKFHRNALRDFATFLFSQIITAECG